MRLQLAFREEPGFLSCAVQGAYSLADCLRLETIPDFRACSSAYSL